MVKDKNKILLNKVQKQKPKVEKSSGKVKGEANIINAK